MVVAGAAARRGAAGGAVAVNRLGRSWSMGPRIRRDDPRGAGRNCRVRRFGSTRLVAPRGVFRLLRRAGMVAGRLDILRDGDWLYAHRVARRPDVRIRLPVRDRIHLGSHRRRRDRAAGRPRSKTIGGVLRAATGRICFVVVAGRHARLRHAQQRGSVNRAVRRWRRFVHQVVRLPPTRLARHRLGRGAAGDRCRCAVGRGTHAPVPCFGAHPVHGRRLVVGLSDPGGRIRPADDARRAATTGPAALA